MAINKKLTSLGTLSATPASSDLFYVVDVSDTTGSAQGTSKKVAFSHLSSGGSNSGATVFWAQASLAGTGSTANAGSADQRWWVEVVIPLSATITGIAFQKYLADEITKIIVELHDTNGVILGYSSLAGTVVNNVVDFQQVPFISPVSVSPGRYFAAFVFNDVGVHMGVMNGSPVAGESAAFVSGFDSTTFGTTTDLTPGTTCYAPVSVFCSTY